MKYAKRKDANHNSIVDALRKHGVDVLDLSDSGKGVADICTNYRNKSVFIEIKTESGAKLKKTQVRFLSMWSGYCGIAQTIDEAIALATDPVANGLTDPQKGKLAEFYMKMTADEIHLPTIAKVLNA
jgi:hypothetical protein